jgi:hypothetical protein
MAMPALLESGAFSFARSLSAPTPDQQITYRPQAILILSSRSPTCHQWFEITGLMLPTGHKLRYPSEFVALRAV